MGEKRLSTAFHRTFTLIRPAVAEVLGVIEEAETAEMKTPLPALLRERTSLGSIYIEAMPRYAYGGGLSAGLSAQRKSLTDAGRQARSNDPYLNESATQWLMHYHLSAPHGPGPAFWHHLVSQSIQLGAILEGTQVAEDIADFVQRESGKALSAETARRTATAFLGTYAKSDGLGPLGLLKATSGETGGPYRVNAPDPPPLWSLAYGLADYWEATWGQQVTINLTELTEHGGFTTLFFIGSDQLMDVLERLQRERVLEVYKAAPPYQVVRLWSDKREFLERLYG